MSDDQKRNNGGHPGGNRQHFNKDAQHKGGDFHGKGGFSGRSGGDRPGFKGEKRPYRGDKPAFDGEKRPFRGDRPAFNGEKRPYRGDKPAFDGEKRPFRGDKPSFNGERKPFGGDRPRTGFRPARPGFRPAAPVNRPARPPRVQTDGMPARRIALTVVRKVTENGAYASLVLNEQLESCGLSLEDRRFAARLAYDTLQHLLYLDYALSQVMAREDTDIRLRNILRLGACQLLKMDRIPEFAICDTCVELTKELGKEAPGLENLHSVCNGILRNLIRKKEAGELTFPDEETEPLKALSIRWSVPEWLAEKLIADYGRDEAVALMACRQQEAIVLRPNLTRLDDAGMEKLLGEKVWQHEPGAVPHAVRITGMADIGHDSGFTRGDYSIESEGSMLAVMALDPKRGQTVLDCCAAPGGKTCYIAELMGGTGRVHSWDLHPHRVDLIEAQVRRLGLENVRPVIRDASVPREELIETMDAVLLDAPCSGTGDMADKPDVKYRPTAGSLDTLVNTQMALLDAVAPYVKRGGTLVYSTCSVLKDENERQVEAFLQRHPEFVIDRLPAAVPERFAQHYGTGLQLLPQRDGVGGFYLCRLKRKRV